MTHAIHVLSTFPHSVLLRKMTTIKTQQPIFFIGKDHNLFSLVASHLIKLQPVLLFGI